MMVDFSETIRPHVVHQGMEENRHERNQLREDEPDIDHLHVGGGGEGVRDGDEEGRENQLGGEVDRHHGLEEERFEEVRGVDNTEDQDAR